MIPTVEEAALRGRIRQLETLNAELLAALEFYADPETYVAIGFFPDPPCGEFVNDFSDDHGHELLLGYRPGKRARAAIAKAKGEI